MTLASYGSITRDEHDSRRTDTDSADRHSAFCDIQAREGAHEAVFGIIANSILGLAAIFALNYFFNFQIPIHLYTLIPSALFGLPAVGTFVILKFFGVLPMAAILL